MHRSYDTFGDVELQRFEVFRFVGGELAVRSSEIALEASTETLAVFGHVGVLDNLDVGVLVPYIRLTLNGTSQIFTDAAGEVQRVLLSSSTSGFGDVALFTKYKFAQFGPPPAVGAGPNGALAVAGTFRLPTGSEEELRGLGVGRAQVAFIGSAAFGRFSPHVNVGYAIRSDTDVSQFQWIAGADLLTTRWLTLVADFLGYYDHINDNVVQSAIGFKANPIGGLVASVGFQFPVNRDGLRADVIYTGQLEYNF